MDQSDLKRAGLKITHGRRRILKLFEQSESRHLSADDVYQALEEQVPLATVYRVLTQFEAAGLLVRHRFDDDHAVYELETGQHHDHLVCTRCHKVVEFVDPLIEQQQEVQAQKQGFVIESHSLYLYGTCRDCR